MKKNKGFKHNRLDNSTTYFRALDKKGKVIAVDSDELNLLNIIKEEGKKAHSFEKMEVFIFSGSDGWKPAKKPSKKNIQISIMMSNASNTRGRRPYQPYRPA